MAALTLTISLVFGQSFFKLFKWLLTPPELRPKMMLCLKDFVDVPVSTLSQFSVFDTIVRCWPSIQILSTTILFPSAQDQHNFTPVCFHNSRPAVSYFIKRDQQFHHNRIKTRTVIRARVPGDCGHVMRVLEMVLGAHGALHAFSEALEAYQDGKVCWSVGPPLWSRYLHSYWADYHEINLTCTLCLVIISQC